MRTHGQRVVGQILAPVFCLDRWLMGRSGRILDNTCKPAWLATCQLLITGGGHYRSLNQSCSNVQPWKEPIISCSYFVAPKWGQTGQPRKLRGERTFSPGACTQQPGHTDVQTQGGVPILRYGVYLRLTFVNRRTT